MGNVKYVAERVAPNDAIGERTAGFLGEEPARVVSYVPRDAGLVKSYGLGDGRNVYVFALKALRQLMRTREMPFDLLIASTSYGWYEEYAAVPRDKMLLLEYEDTAIRGSGSFDADLARRVVEFLGANEEARDVAFACDAGLSRSPALAAACLRGWGYGDGCIWLNPHFRPNTLVYQLTCEAYGIDATDAEAEELAEANEAALAAAIDEATARMRRLSGRGDVGCA